MFITAEDDEHEKAIFQTSRSLVSYGGNRSANLTEPERGNVKNHHECTLISAGAVGKRPFGFTERPLVSYPIQHVEIDWDRLIAKRPMLLESLKLMPKYRLKPEILGLLESEAHPLHRLILDLMWCTGARVSEVVAVTTASFVDDGYDFGVWLKTLKQGAGRPTRVVSQLVGHPSVEFTEVYTNVLTFDGPIFLEGVDFC